MSRSPIPRSVAHDRRMAAAAPWSNDVGLSTRSIIDPAACVFAAINQGSPDEVSCRGASIARRLLSWTQSHSGATAKITQSRPTCSNVMTTGCGGPDFQCGPLKIWIWCAAADV